jgi:hypothetical protein
VTIKFQNRHYYNITTNALVRENVYLCDVEVSTSLIDVYEDYNYVVEVSCFFVSKASKLEQKVAIES